MITNNITTHNITASNAPAALRATAASRISTATVVPAAYDTAGAAAGLFQALLQSHRQADAFRPDLQSIGTKSPVPGVQVNAATLRGMKSYEGWCISDNYKLPPNAVPQALEEIRQEITDAGFAGMTDIQVYDWIEKKFIEKFGEDFMMAHSLGVLDPGTGTGNYMSIGFEFIGVVSKQFEGKYETAPGAGAYTEVNRMRLYGSMSEADMMDAIRAKYPPNERITNRDVCLMLAEMGSVGAMYSSLPVEYVEYLVSEKDANGNILRTPAGTELGEAWLRQLDKAVSPGVLNGINNREMRNGRSGDLELLAERNFLIKYLGADAGPGGFLLPDELEKIEIKVEFDLSNITPNLEEEFMNSVDKHVRKLAEDREERRAGERERDRNHGRVNSAYEINPRRTGLADNRGNRVRGEDSPGPAFANLH